MKHWRRSMNNNRSDALPKNWVYIDIGTCYKVVGGGTPSTSVKEYWGGETPWITSADIGGVRDIHLTRHITQKGIRESATNMVPERSLLVATRVGLGKIAITDKPICFSQDLQGLVQRPDLILPEYGLFFLSFQLQRLKFEGRGTTISGITKKQLKDTELPLPPYQEQRRIVTKIEELFSELDRGIKSLKAAQAKLTVYRQSLLKHAFEGKLTAQWREENKDKLESPEQLTARIKQEQEAYYEQQRREWKAAVKKWEERGRLGRKPSKPRKLKGGHDPKIESPVGSKIELPDGWCETTFGEVVQNMVINDKKLPKKKYSEAGIFPVIDQGQEIVGGYYDDEDSVINSALPLIVFGDHTRIFKFLNRPFVPGADGVKVLMALGVDDKWLYHIAHALDFPNKGYSRHFQHLKKARLLVPSLPEQHQIVKKIEKKLTVLEMLDNTLNQQLSRAATLRQSILKNAFSGQLIPQDPQDDPASILLERIRAEKAVQSQINTRVKCRPTAATT